MKVGTREHSKLIQMPTEKPLKVYHRAIFSIVDCKGVLYCAKLASLSFDLCSRLFDLYDSFHSTASGTDQWTGTVNSTDHEEVCFPVSFTV